MKKHILFGLLASIVFFTFPLFGAFAQQQTGPVSRQDGFYKGNVTVIEKDEKQQLGSQSTPTRLLP